MAAKKKNTKLCVYCREELSLSKFHSSKSPIHKDGRVDMCRNCVVKFSIDDQGNVDENKFKIVLRKLDKPFYSDVLNEIIEKLSQDAPDEFFGKGKEIISAYLQKACGLKQYNTKTYDDSVRTNHIYAPVSAYELSNSAPEPAMKVYDRRADEYKVDPEAVELFGEGYTPIEYRSMMRKYEKLKESYALETAVHEETLITYIRFKVKEEIATSRGDVEEATKWNKNAQDVADKGKLTARQISKADLQGGITNFSDIFRAVEEANERIPIFPEFKYKPNDAPDFIIWCYINYERNLHGMPEVPYYDIYKFYDQKKKEYIDMYGDPFGIFANDPSLANRETIQKFITIPVEFRDEA